MNSDVPAVLVWLALALGFGLGAVVGWAAGERENFIAGREHGEYYGKLDGRCIELCRPEHFLERISNGSVSECICTNTREKLGKVP